MATIPTLAHPHSTDSIACQLLELPIFSTLDLFELTDCCCAFVNVLLETHDKAERLALCGRLSFTFDEIKNRCDEDLPLHLVEQLSNALPAQSCVPDCWQDTAMLVGYAQALNQALLSQTLASAVSQELAGLLHDLVYLLADFVREPYLQH
ncbi:hypothetical protein JGL56_03290 [Salmonella enterica subsp. enterica serovar Derby]|uniref:hypothetical protein n=1 Tax=Enterobacter quasiroggenkampii TaxID=2497436 RepID=UPI001A362519|nr:hypothetical protein [Enterobacter quasiroggenkampii]MBJ5866754.1 hypothetical protein [Salmonella enterica subsp. enterica serovar Derby]MCK7307242.1 hypothetical protein [Enterobacter quasiroggenkampii]